VIVLFVQQGTDVVKVGTLNASATPGLVRAGAVFKNGELIEQPDESEGSDQHVS